jgi:hypothetical protein
MVTYFLNFWVNPGFHALAVTFCHMVACLRVVYREKISLYIHNAAVTNLVLALRISTHVTCF